ncbi:MAG: hypothetical protein ACI82J_000891, partial [Sulfitobacter litoralis]
MREGPSLVFGHRIAGVSIAFPSSGQGVVTATKRHSWQRLEEGCP